MYPPSIPEEELKNQVAQDFFSGFNTTRILGKIDFCVSFDAKSLFQSIHFLWAEAKKGNKSDILESFVQLILTIGKERTFEAELPPLFLGAFDCEKIALIPYHDIEPIFYQNDFNWNITPSNHESKEFKQLYATSKELLESKKLQFDFTRDLKEFKSFIKANFSLENQHLHKIQITKNNFTIIYQKWLLSVKDSISIDWNLAKNAGIMDSDFYLADLLSSENQSLLDKLFVVLQKTHYEFNKTITFMGTEQKDTATFKDNQKAHLAFWNLYERPPKQEYWDYIIDRRDLLVPSDIRERKGAFFTPQIWAQKAQDYLAKALGEDWQSEYTVWDCAAGTGNLLANFTESRNLYASTLDIADVKIMKELSSKKSLSLLENHIFQFDFLNDILLDKPCDKHKDKLDSTCKDCIKSKLPKSLQEILKDEKKREKLIIFINPPYAEAASATQVTNTGSNKSGVSLGNATYEKYKNILGKASNELFAQFFIRIYQEIPRCKLAAFSKLKYINSSNFVKFRETFLAKFLRGFAVPAFTFDNVKGQFPIGFLVWDLSQKVKFRKIRFNVFGRKEEFLGKKQFYTKNTDKKINDWYSTHYDKGQDIIGIMNTRGNDFQNQNYIRITSTNNYNHTNIITPNNLIPSSIYFSVRHAIPATWLNDRDQFLYPNDLWQQDSNFQNDCLAFMLFHGQNRITSKEGVNHFIPFSESKVGAKEAFASNFMVQFINGKIKDSKPSDSAFEAEETIRKNLLAKGLFSNDDLGIVSFIPTQPLSFSDEAQAVFAAGLELWKYYHSQDFSDSKNPYNANASLYDIKAYFQGFNDKGKMNPPQKAQDSHYKNLIGNLNYELKILTKKIEPKIYEYGFLLE